MLTTKNVTHFSECLFKATLGRQNVELLARQENFADGGGEEARTRDQVEAGGICEESVDNYAEYRYTKLFDRPC